ncbi:PTS EIIA type-2 domain-containing protein [Candidatus Magnetomoraceae bacterium gMMP-13]
MEIWNHLKTEQIFLNIHLSDKDDVLRFASDAFIKNGAVKDNINNLYEGMKKREKVMSTGIGKGIGIPHTTSHEAEELGIILIRLVKSIDFDALDYLPVDIIFALVIPENETDLHLQALARISRLCCNYKFLNSVRHAENAQELLNEIKLMEKEIAKLCTC